MAGEIMLIDVSGLNMQPGQSKMYDLTTQLDDILYAGDRLVFDSPACINFTLNNLGKTIEVKGEIIADLIIRCARCLSPFVYHLESEFKGKFSHDRNTALADQNFEDEEDIYLYSGNNIDLSQLLVESVLLALPMKNLCNEKCKGLCQVCGINLNEEQCNCNVDDIDPRLAVLQKFMETSHRKED
jgi:uncharacterized protein